MNLIKEIRIKNISHLFDLICGKENIPDLRDNFIFRGVGKESYDLIPSSLRRKENNADEFVIGDYIDSTFQIVTLFSPDQLLNLKTITKADYDSNMYSKDARTLLSLDKNFKIINKLDNLINHSEIVIFTNHLYFLRENFVLSKFLNCADKAGLNVSVDRKIRQNMHFKLNNELVKEEKWPNENYFELIALAQHYDIPTCALDWSYNYKHALYFAVKNILNDSKNQENNCILWAFNYEKFELFNIMHSIPLYCYRPKYIDNENLNAQKGLMLFWINKINSEVDLRSLEIKLIEAIENFKEEDSDGNVIYNAGNANYILNKDDTLFYKFIISGDFKAEILNELYKENISEEFLFPGYDGVVTSIRNKVKLNELEIKE